MIAFVFVFVREDTPVDELVGRGRAFDQPFFGEGSAGSSGAGFMPLDVFAFGLFSITAVEDLPGGGRVVTVVGKVLREGGVVLVFGQSTEEGSKSVDTGGIGPKSQHERAAGGIAERRLTVSVVEKGAAFCEGIDVGRLRIWMSIQAPDPVILIIDGDEEDIRLLGALQEGN